MSATQSQLRISCVADMQPPPGMPPGVPGSVGPRTVAPGLVEGEWHLRDLEAPEGEALGTGWYEEFLKWRHIHRRDQLSFNYVAWKLGTSELRGFKYVVATSGMHARGPPIRLKGPEATMVREEIEQTMGTKGLGAIYKGKTP